MKEPELIISLIIVPNYTGTGTMIIYILNIPF
jgi:hypothetical protein